MAAADYALARAAVLRGDTCIPCPDGCVDCSRRGHVLIRPGYGLSRAATMHYTGLDDGNARGAGDTRLFSCPLDGVCLGEHVGNATDAATVARFACPEGQAGALCAQCDTGWVGGTASKLCKDCRDAKEIGAGMWIVLILALLLLLAFAGFVANRLYGRCCSGDTPWKGAYETAQEARDQLAEIQGLANSVLGAVGVDTSNIAGALRALPERAKILVSNVQILSQMPEVLRFEFGASFKRFLGVFAFLKLDIMSGMSLGCSLTSNLYSKFFMSMSFPGWKNTMSS